MSTAFHPQTDRQTERVNQELEQYLRIFIDYRQEQQPDQLGIAEFAYNNKAHSSTKMLPFKANYGQDPRMGFEIRKKRKYEGAEKFVTKMKEIQEKTKAALRKAQEKIKKYAQMVRKRTEKLMERYIGPYKIKKIISSNAVELELPSTVKIYLVVNVSKIKKYIGQVKGQRKEQPTLVIIEEKEEQEVKKILNKQYVTNFIWSYLHQFFDDSHGLKASLKPLRRPFDRCQSHLEAINNGRDIKQINW